MDGISNSNRVEGTTNRTQGQAVAKRYKKLIKKRKAKVQVGY